MSKVTRGLNVATTARLSASVNTANAPLPFTQTTNFPRSGAIRSIMYRYDATMSGTSTPTRVTNGQIQFLSSMTVKSDKHGLLVSAASGQMLRAMNIFEYGTDVLSTALSSTPTDSDTPGCSWLIPFTVPKGFRPYDTNLDMDGGNAILDTVVQFAPGNRLWTQAGGTPLVTGITDSWEARYLPSLRAGTPDDTELPNSIRTFEQANIPITATTARYPIEIKADDRRIRRIYIGQFNSSTGVELSTVVPATASISLEVGEADQIHARRRFVDIQSENKLRYAIETLPTGVACIDFDSDEQDRLQDALDLYGVKKAYLYVDVTAVTNGNLSVLIDSNKTIPDAARREGQVVLGQTLG